MLLLSRVETCFEGLLWYVMPSFQSSGRVSFVPVDDRMCLVTDLASTSCYGVMAHACKEEVRINFGINF